MDHNSIWWRNWNIIGTAYFIMLQFWVVSNCFLNSRLYPRSLVFHINQAQPFLLSFLSQIFSNCVLFKTISCKYCKIITFSEKKVLLQINSNCVLFRTINSKLSNCQTMPISERKIMLYKKFNFCPYQKKNML